MKKDKSSFEDKVKLEILSLKERRRTITLKIKGLEKYLGIKSQITTNAN